MTDEEAWALTHIFRPDKKVNVDKEDKK